MQLLQKTDTCVGLLYCADTIVIAGVPAVLKFLKFQNCPEILLIWQECPENGFWCTITCCSFLFYWLFLHHAIVVTVCIWQLQVITSWIMHIVDIDCPVVLLTGFMTALFSSDLHEWFLLKKKVCVYYVYLAACGRKMSLNCPEI